jgi:hypothetical protein
MEEGLQSLAPLDWLDVEGEGFLPGSSFLGAPQGALAVALLLVHAPGV